jgi:Ornithine cyclodeaminase/mu-crystallin family
MSPMQAETARKLNVVPFVSVDNMMRLVLDIGIERVLTELAAHIEEDFRRWELFDKTPRIAAHSSTGVIELMPTSDGESYGFKPGFPIWIRLTRSKAAETLAKPRIPAFTRRVRQNSAT